MTPREPEYCRTVIDYEALDAAYRRQGFYSLQLEVGDLCHQGCVYCYMNALEQERNTLPDELIGSILEDARKLGITAVEWLGGEPLLRESVFDHMAHAARLGLRNNVWTGGLPLADSAVRERTAELTRRGLISIHVSTLDPELYTELHPARGRSRAREDLSSILESVQELLEGGYPSSQLLNSVTFTGLQSAVDMIRTMDVLVEKLGVLPSLNVYHTYLRPATPMGELERFIPTEEAVRKVYRHYSRLWGVEELPMNCVSKQYCSATVAVLCDGGVTPCATIRGRDAPSLHGGGSFYGIATEHRDRLTFAAFRDRANLPEDCRRCRLSGSCFGCRSRAFAAGRGVYGKDPRCFRGTGRT
jgi:radical SAM protein with 4Fe4S-binding SPASM domain